MVKAQPSRLSPLTLRFLSGLAQRSFYFQIESRVKLGENEGHNYVLEMMFVSTIFMRVAMPADIPAMMKVIASARQFLGAQGIDQW